MDIVQYTPNILTPLTQFYNHLTANVPFCYPVNEHEFSSVLPKVNNEVNKSVGRLNSDNVFVAMKNGVVHAFVHFGIAHIGPNNKTKIGVIPFLGYNRGKRSTAQALLEIAETYLRRHHVTKISAFRSGFEYQFYHIEHANLSLALEHVHALLGFNGYKPLQRWVYFGWENYTVKPIPPPIPVKLSVNWSDGQGELPDCTVKVYHENKLIGDCCSLSGGEFSSHPDAQKWLHTVWLEINEEFWGKGIGKYLLHSTLQEMYGVGYRHAQISTSSDNSCAILFYSNCGYRVFDQTFEFEKIITETPVCKVFGTVA